MQLPFRTLHRYSIDLLSVLSSSLTGPCDEDPGSHVKGTCHGFEYSRRLLQEIKNNIRSIRLRYNVTGSWSTISKRRFRASSALGGSGKLKCIIDRFVHANNLTRFCSFWSILLQISIFLLYLIPLA